MSVLPSPLPHRPRLVRRALHRAPDVLQFGVDPRDALVVDGLTPPLARMVDALDGSRPLARVLADAAAAGASPSAARRVLEDLHGAGLLTTQGEPAGLADRRVVVRGGGRVAVAVACLLAAAGVGRVLVEADGVVCRDDVGTGLVADDVGRPARTAIEDAVARAGGRPVPAGAPSRRWLTAHADLVVLADAERPDPVAASRLVLDGRVHLPVAPGSVGPLVVPGVTPCLHCDDLARTEVDPSWPRLAAELAGHRPVVPVVAASAAAARAADRALAALAGTAVDVRGAVMEVDADGGRRRRVLRRHPGCGCGSLGVRSRPVDRPTDQEAVAA